MPRSISAARVVIKSGLLFLCLEYALLTAPLPMRATSAYRALGLDRERFPTSTIAPADAALDVGNLDAMFGSHVISRQKAAGEYRVLVLGDSTVWGFQLSPEDVLSGQLNRLALSCGELHARFYNLSFPRSSATKDLMILDYALSTQPDMIVWLITWYTLMPKTRTDHWLISQNPDEFFRLATRFDFLPGDFRSPNLLDEAFTQNRSLFRAGRYQLYSLVELASGQDQIAGPPQVLPSKLSPDVMFEGLKPPTLNRAQVSLDQIVDFHELAGNLPVLLVNEPILRVSDDPNSTLRYNHYYPRWIYDQYRDYLLAEAAAQSWWSLDMWDMFSPEYFTDTPLHLNPEGHRLLAERLAPEIERECQ